LNMCEVKEVWQPEPGTVCPLLQLPAVVWEHLLALLPLPALAALATTCTQLDAAVGEFLRHQCRSSNTEARLVTFLARCTRRPGVVNHPILTPAESQLYFPAGAHMLTGRRELYRQLAARPLLRHPVWRVLQVRVTVTGGRMGLSYTWPVLPPGRYTASLRFSPADPPASGVQIPSSLEMRHWPGPLMQWRLQAGQEILQVTTDHTWWQDIHCGRTPPDLGELSVIRENEEDRGRVWVRVQFGSLHISEEAQITFQVTDDEDGHWWESGVFLDFLELRLDDHAEFYFTTLTD